MAPVTRAFLDSFYHQEKHLHSRVPSNNKFYKSFKLVQCTLHLDQIEKNGRGFKKIQRLAKSSHKKTNGRIIYPMVFKHFDPDTLTKPNKDGNVSFIMNLNTLLQRFPKIYDNGINKHRNSWCQSVVATRCKRDLSRYTPLETATPTTTGDVWMRDEEDNNFILDYCSRDDDKDYILEFNVDVLLSDLKWMKKNWICECFDHLTCAKNGEVCTNLMERSTAWQAFHT